MLLVMVLVAWAPLWGAAKIFEPQTKPDEGDPLMRVGLLDVAEPLILTGRPEARRLARVDPQLFAGVESYAGFFTVDAPTSSNLFFWFFPAALQPLEAPLVLWLQGGPGISALAGLFEENGPFEVDEQGRLQRRAHSWHGAHNLLYVDSPAGTGFSYTSAGFSTSVNQTAAHLLAALTQFVQLFPEWRHNRFFIAASGIAARDALALGALIREGGDLNLQGLILESAWFHPAGMAWSDHLFGLGLLDRSDLRHLQAEEIKWAAHLQAARHPDAEALLSMVFSGNGSFFYNATRLPSLYDFAADAADDAAAPFEALLDDTDIKEALHVGSVRFNMQQKAVYEHLSHEIVKSSGAALCSLLEHYRVLLFNGQRDIITAYPVTMGALHALGLEPKGVRCPWYVGDRLAGYAKGGGRLTEALVRNAGHVVAADQPQAVLDLVHKFIRGVDLCQ